MANSAEYLASLSKAEKQQRKLHARYKPLTCEDFDLDDMEEPYVIALYIGHECPEFPPANIIYPCAVFACYSEKLADKAWKMYRRQLKTMSEECGPALAMAIDGVWQKQAILEDGKVKGDE